MSARAPFVFRGDPRGLRQLRIATADDLDRIHELEEARWSATSAPVGQLACDPRFLALVDDDANGRIRLREVQAAHRWARERLRDPACLASGTDTLRLDDVHPEHADGKAMRALGERLLRELGKPAGTRTLSLAEIRAFRDSYAKRLPNGDGVVTAAQATDADVAALCREVVEATGGAPDLSGEPGARAQDVATLRARMEALLAWTAEDEAPAGGGPNPLEPLGADTAAAAALVAGLRPRLELHWARCDLVAHEQGAAARLAATPEALAALDVKDPAAIRKFLEEAPLAPPDPQGRIDLEGPGLNPLHADALRRLAREVLPRVPGAAPEGGGPVRVLERRHWQAVLALLGPRLDWEARRPQGLPGSVDAGRARALLAGDLLGRLEALCAQDGQASHELQQVGNLEQLALYQRWLLELANNFVSFPSLFEPGQRALFQAGRLVLDGRDLAFTVNVDDRGGHKKVMATSSLFVVYVELTRKEGGAERKREVAAAVTAGTRGGIEVGKRGVFYDRDGKEWDAQIVDLHAAPISLLEAVLAPFTRLKALVGEKVEKLTAGALEGVEKKASGAVATAAPPAAPAPAGGGFRDVLVGGGIAFAALGSTLAFIIKTLSDIDPKQVGLMLLLTVAFVALLSGFLGWLKLRSRDLSTVLEASAWAMNARMFLTRPQSVRFTRRPPLPAGSKVLRRRTWAALLWLLVLLGGAGAAAWHWRADLEALVNPPAPAPAEPAPAAPAPEAAPGGG